MGRPEIPREDTEGPAWRMTREPAEPLPVRLVVTPRKMVRTGLARKRIFHIGNAMKALREDRPDGPIAQLDRVADFYSAGCRFESCWDRQYLPCPARRHG